MMRCIFSRSLLLLFIPAFLLSALSCERFQENPDDPVLARVGNETLTLNAALQSIPEVVLRQDTLAAIRNYQSSWVEERIMLREASRLGLDSDPEIARRAERLRSQLIMNALKEVLIASRAEELSVDQEEARNYYQANRERFILDERYIRFRHMTTSSRVDADNARRALLNGVEWPEVAQRYSVDPERQLRDSRRFIPLSLAAPDLPLIRRYLDVIGRTEISQIVAHGGQFHFVQLMEERPAGSNPDLDWLIDQISDWLYLEKSQRYITSYRRNLYLQADANNEIEITDVADLKGFSANEVQQADPDAARPESVSETEDSE